MKSMATYTATGKPNIPVNGMGIDFSADNASERRKNWLS
jgi:hypothetical protein